MICLGRLFSETDQDADKSIATEELRKLVGNIFGAGNSGIEKNDAVNNVMNLFDISNDGKITEEEFITGFRQWAYEADKSASNKDFFPKNMSQQVTNQTLSICRWNRL